MGSKPQPDQPQNRPQASQPMTGLLGTVARHGVVYERGVPSRHEPINFETDLDYYGEIKLDLVQHAQGMSFRGNRDKKTKSVGVRVDRHTVVVECFDSESPGRAPRTYIWPLREVEHIQHEVT